MPFYGRGSSSSDSNFGYTGGTNAENQRATIYTAMPEHGWGFRMGARLGIWHLDPGSATVRLGVWRLTSTDVAAASPGIRLGYTGSFSVTNEASYSAEAQLYTSNISVTNSSYSPTNSAIMLWSGQTYSLGFSHTGQSLFHQQINAANVSYPNEKLFRRSTSSSVPTDPFNASVESVQGIITAYIEYQANSAPSTPTGLAPTGTINTLTPTFTTTFADADTTYGDSLKQMFLEVRVGSTTGTVVWNPTVDAQSSAVYAGTALVAGNTYYWRAQHSDQFGATSSWTAWQSFTVNGGGFVATPSSPSGKLETQTPSPFQATWTHNNSLSTNAVEVQILQGGTVVRGPVQVAKTVAAGGTISVTWAETGFTALPWGTAYTVQIRARDTGSLWSSWASGSIRTNAAPSIPSNLAPPPPAAVTGYPLLVCQSSDPDTAIDGTDNPATGGLTVSARIKDNSGTTLQTRAMTWNGALSRFEYQTIAADLASYATYRWDARAYDGTLYSDYSPEVTFAYGAGPTVTGTNPTASQTITTNTPTITWTTTDQQKYQVDIYRTSTGALVYSSGLVTSTTSSHLVPTGYLFNNTTYQYTVLVENSVPLQGSSAAVTFSVAYTAPTQITNFQASQFSAGNDAAPSAILLSWDAATDNPAKFVEYTLSRTNAATGDTIILARLTSIEQNRFVDYLPASGVTYTYGISKTILQGSNEQTISAQTTAQQSVTLTHPVICSAQDGGTYRIGLQLLKALSLDHKEDGAYFLTWGSEQPTVITSPSHYHRVTASFDIITDVHGSAEDKIQNIRALKGSGHTTCYRDDRGLRYFGYMTVKETYGPLGRYVVTLDIVENNFAEGVE